MEISWHHGFFIRLFKYAMLRHTLSLRDALPIFLSIAFSLDSSKLASGSRDCVRIWNVVTGKTEQILKVNSDSAWSMAFSPDNTKLASGSGTWTIQIWDITTGKMELMLEGHSDAVLSIAFSPDSSKL